MICLLCLVLCQFDCGLCRWWCWCAVGGDSESLLSAFGWSWNSNFVVQCSTNLAGSNWINLLSLTNLPSSPYQFLDPAGGGESARFYRAFMR